MKKAKGKMELRYYDIPQNEFLIALQNQNWQNKYQTEEDGLHFSQLLEIRPLRSGIWYYARKKKTYILKPVC